MEGRTYDVQLKQDAQVVFGNEGLWQAKVELIMNGAAPIFISHFEL